MLPLQDLFSQLDEELNINSSESIFTELYYTDLINEQRALLIRNEYNKNRSIDPNIQQTIGCLELELVDPTVCCFTVPGLCKVLRSVLPIPNTIEFYNSKGLTSVGPVDLTKPRYSYIDFARVPFIGHGRTTKNTIYVFLLDNYLYVISNNISFISTKYITIRGIFEDPTVLEDFCNCDGSCCWSPNDIYPMNSWMWVYAKDMIVQKLLRKKSIRQDDSNDGKDGLIETNGTKQ
jgi:hypothetical protein